jgi:hypothetical protein
VDRRLRALHTAGPLPPLSPAAMAALLAACRAQQECSRPGDTCDGDTTGSEASRSEASEAREEAKLPAEKAKARNEPRRERTLHPPTRGEAYARN